MTTPTFEQLNLDSSILKAISDLNFEAPSQIQFEAIPRIMNNEDIIAMAPTGSGKTFAFSIPALQKVDAQNINIQILILCPTRELVIQAHREIEKLTKYLEDIKVVSVYGGQNIDKQLNALKRNPQVIVATPGRLMDHLRRESISLQNVSTVVLDEADEMLDMGFREDIHTILKETPQNRQTILFSATMAKGIIALTQKFQKTPFTIDVRDNLLNAPNISQHYFEVVEKEKPELITRLLELHNLKLALIFCNTKANVDKLVETLKTKGYFADSLHGDMNQGQREKVMRGFKNGSVKVLIATDVAGRGIDVENVDCVFNYDLPRDDEDYIHRIGRTARAGRSGVAFSLVSKKQISSLRKIERANGLKIEKSQLPTFEDIKSAKFDIFAKEIKEIIKSADLESFVEQINTMVDEENSLTQIAAALLKLSTNKEAMKINRKLEFSIENSYEEKKDRKRSRFSSKGRGYKDVLSLTFENSDDKKEKKYSDKNNSNFKKRSSKNSYRPKRAGKSSLKLR